MKLSAIASELSGAEYTADAEIRGLCTDSRTAAEGDLFFCLRGRNYDAHEFARDAAARGVAAVMCERRLPLSCPQLIVPDARAGMAMACAAFYRHPERKMKIVGVTGTNGKTTTAHMIYHILAQAGQKAGLIGTLGAAYAGRSLAPTLTTPDPVMLFSLLAEMRRAGVQTVVLEVSAHALALKKECPIVYEVGVFTNLSRDHLDFFADMKAYGAAKLEMFRPARCRFAVVNADDDFSREIVRLRGEASTGSYALETPADAFAVVESAGLGGTRLMLNLSDALCEASIPLPGQYNISNALAAACAAERLGADMSDIALGLASTAHVDGRMERVARCNGGTVFVDYAHTPDGLEKALTALRAHCEGRLIVLFGCGGNRDAGKRREMGECAARLADFAVLTSDNPRYEDPCAILAAIEEGFKAISDRYVVIEERERAIEYAVRMLRQGDVLLVAGKGGERYQEIMGIKYDFNDKAVIRSVVERCS